MHAPSVRSEHAPMKQTVSYTGIHPAKNGNAVPFYQETQESAPVSLHSLYNPERESQGFANQAESDFFIVLGIAGGYHINALAQKNPQSTIIAVETNEATLDFLSQIPLVQSLTQNSRILLTTIDKLDDAILSHYKPALHGNLTILALRQWEHLFSNESTRAREKITETLKLLSGDYSVQRHFGKIWQKNILTNLSLAEQTLSFDTIKQATDTTKIAAIIAAGPSLNKTIRELAAHQERYFIIATDTAYSVLCAYGITCDAVVSIDGQNVSHAHYLHGFSETTLYAFDVCANDSSVRKALAKKARVLLFETGHPLAQYASLFSGKRHFAHLEAGSGTVTIAAASLAKQLGFTELSFFGADFSYSDGSPYARGTYLEPQFYKGANRLSTAETAYTALLYRTPVKPVPQTENAVTTDILEAYKDSLAAFLKANEHVSSKNTPICEEQFNFAAFKRAYTNDLSACVHSEHDFDSSTYAFTTLLPLCAALGKNSAFLAYLKTLRYTESI